MKDKRSVYNVVPFAAVKYRGTLSVVFDDDARVSKCLEGYKYLLSFDIPLHLTLKYQ